MIEELRVHEEWATNAFDLPPVAPHTGPFVRRDVLRTWYDHRGRAGKALLVDSGDALLPLYAEGDVVRFLGEADLTDYHSPLGTAADVEALFGAFGAELAPGTDLVLDSLPAAAADTVVAGLQAAGISTTSNQHEVAAVLALPATFDDWLAGIGKKERHEVRRKRRRFEAEIGTPTIVRADGPEAVDRFVELHRRATGAKGTFMDAGMAELFHDLHINAGAVVDELRGPDEATIASAFGFEDDTAYYLYNSAYDSEFRQASPGVVLLAALVERSIAAGFERLDFLKGDEPYKFRHGAQPRPLFVVTGRVPS